MDFINVEAHLKYINSLPNKDDQINKLKDIIVKLQDELNIVQIEARDWCVAWEEIFDIIKNNDFVYSVVKFGTPISFKDYKEYQVENHCFTPAFDYDCLNLFRVENDKIICIGEDADIDLTDDHLVQTYIMRRVKLN